MTAAEPPPAGPTTDDGPVDAAPSESVVGSGSSGLSSTSAAVDAVARALQAQAAVPVADGPADSVVRLDLAAVATLPTTQPPAGPPGA